MLPRCRRRVLPSSCPGAVDGGGGVGDGFRAVGAGGGTAVGANEGPAIAANGGTAVAAGAGGERRKLYSLISLSG